jgi:hypothetical protein
MPHLDGPALRQQHRPFYSIFISRLANKKTTRDALMKSPQDSFGSRLPFFENCLTLSSPLTALYSTDLMLLRQSLLHSFLSFIKIERFLLMLPQSPYDEQNLLQLS